MKKLLFTIVVMAMTVSFSACGSSGCDKCERISEIQERVDDLNKYINENRINEGSAEFEKNEQELKNLNDQLDTLLQHDCPLPVENVENKEYRYGGYIGTYTGEWKYNAPNGEGSYEAISDNGKEKISYTGSWARGSIDGYGTYYHYNELNGGEEKFYEGEFKDNKFHGQGFYKRISPSGDILQIDGEWEKNKLVIGDFKEIDANGNLTDYGTMDINGKITSAKADAEAKRQEELKKQQEEAIGDAIGDLFNWVF